jgi:mannose-1-phosphate guanylyltransferase
MFIPDTRDLWTVILAGGDGTRLRSLTRRITGDDRPKQFCALVDRETLLERTRRRVDLFTRPDHHVVVVTRRHARFWQPLSGELAPGRLVVQPSNRGTLAGIVYPLLRIRALAGNPVAVVTPSDHEVTEPRTFAAQVTQAALAIEEFADRIVMMGVEAESPETEYGWIEPEPTPVLGGGVALHGIRQFVEKPSPSLARELFARGCLWNSFVMVGRVDAFLDLVGQTEPDSLATLARLGAAGGAGEERLAEEVYAKLEPANFSERVLARVTGRLLVTPLEGVGWCDMGSPQRVLASLRQSGRTPPWAAAPSPAFGV